jgi:DNA-binding MarR family transcriptional regulator
MQKPLVPTPFALDRFTPYRLASLTGSISASLARVYAARFGIGIPEWRMMANLGRTPGLTAAALAAASTLDKVAVSRALARLRARGLVEAAGDDDRRRRRLSLTPAGRALHDEIVPLALAHEAALLGVLSDSERATLDGLLTKLQARAEALAQP